MLVLCTSSHRYGKLSSKWEKSPRGWLVAMAICDGENSQIVGAIARQECGERLSLSWVDLLTSCYHVPRQVKGK